MTAQTRLLTYNDLFALPDDGKRYELIDGVLVEMPSPSFFHGRLVLELIRLIDAYLTPRGLSRFLFTAPVDVRLSDTVVVAPDIFVVSPERTDAFSNPPAVSGPPDLIVEVLSPWNRAHDQITKRALYEQAGVPEYWIADQAAAAMAVNVLRDGRYVEHPIVDGLATSEVLPGLQIDVAALCAGLAESGTI